jgi:hypothetical protein
MNSGITRVVYDEYHQAKIDWIKGKILCEQLHSKESISKMDYINGTFPNIIESDGIIKKPIQIEKIIDNTLKRSSLKCFNENNTNYINTYFDF